jgi:hypothetical protein
MSSQGGHRRIASGFTLVVVTIAAWGAWGLTAAARQSGPSDNPETALLARADASRAGGRCDEAIAAYERILATYPRSPIVPRASLDAASCMVAIGQWERAVTRFQQVRTRFPDSREAVVALERNTILYRLHLKPGQQRYQWARTPTSPTTIPRALDLDVDANYQLYVTTSKSTAVFDESNQRVRTLQGDDTRAMVVSGDVPIFIESRGIRADAGVLIPVRINEQGRLRDMDLAAAAPSSPAEILIADRRSKAIHRIASDGTYRGRFAAVDAIRLAVGPLNEVAAVERETRRVMMMSPDGSPRPFPAQGSTYQMRAPTDVAFDPLGHLYVLERDSVVVFAPTGELLTVFTPSTAGVFQTGASLAVDGAGRLYVYDQDSERVQVFH